MSKRQKTTLDLLHNKVYPTDIYVNQLFDKYNLSVE